MAFLFILIGVAQLGLLVWALRLYQNSPNWYAFLMLPALAFLAYDNFVIAAGASIGAGETLKILNAVRFYAHALLTPLLIIFAFGVARRAGIGWAQSRRNHILFCLLATVLVLFGVYIDIINLTLELKDEFGMLRYVNIFFKGPPIPSVITIIVLGVVGFMLWRRDKSWWMLAGSVLMFIGALVGLRVPSLSNLGEVAMSGALIDGEKTAQALKS